MPPKLWCGLTDPNLGFGHVSREGIRVNGHAEIDESPEVIAGLPGARRLLRVTAEHIFTNCPRYIPKLSLEEPSVYVPRAGYKPPDPPWKSMPFVKDIF